MLICEHKLRLSRAHAAAIDEAIRTTQFPCNKAVRLWMGESPSVARAGGSKNRPDISGQSVNNCN
jgi:hypothetical protein